MRPLAKSILNIIESLTELLAGMLVGAFVVISVMTNNKAITTIFNAEDAIANGRQTHITLTIACKRRPNARFSCVPKFGGQNVD
jgi:hypothetical protein